MKLPIEKLKRITPETIREMTPAPIPPEQKPQRPIRIRNNILAKPTKKWWQIWKKQKEYAKRIQLTPEMIEEAITLEKEGKPIILNIPEEGYQSIPEPETIEPILILMKENGYSPFIENVKPGEFVIETPTGRKSITLRPEKQTTFQIGEKYYKGWVAHESNMTPYPEDPIYDSETMRRIIEKISVNYKDFNEVSLMKAKTKFWIGLIAVIGIILVLLISSDFGKTLIAQITQPSNQPVQTIQYAAQTIAENITKATTSTTGITVT